MGISHTQHSASLCRFAKETCSQLAEASHCHCMSEKLLYRSIIQVLTLSGHTAERFESEHSRYGNSLAMPIGWPDIAGYHKLGTTLLIEVKLPKEIAHGLRSDQLDRLLDGISKNCFAVCVCSYTQAKERIERWERIEERRERQLYLLECLPPKYTDKHRRRVETKTHPVFMSLKRQLNKPG